MLSKKKGMNFELHDHSSPLTCNSLNSIFPSKGHVGDGTQSGIVHAASDGIVVNFLILSTETILFSTRQEIKTAENNTELRDRLYDKDNPTSSVLSNIKNH